jgi:hypothetical protein
VKYSAAAALFVAAGMLPLASRHPVTGHENLLVEQAVFERLLGGNRGAAILLRPTSGSSTADTRALADHFSAEGYKVVLPAAVVLGTRPDGLYGLVRKTTRRPAMYYYVDDIHWWIDGFAVDVKGGRSPGAGGSHDIISLFRLGGRWRVVRTRVDFWE